jgi:hemolysin III
MNINPLKKLKKPLLRGYFHLVAFFISLGAGLTLLTKCHSTETFSSCLVYVLSLALLFGSSSLYHRPQWGLRAYNIMRRIDHSAIFILIAGTATPVCLLGLRGKMGVHLLIIFWVAAILGISQALLWSHGPKWLRAVVYIVMGWLALPYFAALEASLGPENGLLILAGGVIYTLGALVYALKKPDPYPEVFGFHEIFHIMVVIAAALHFSVIYQLASSYNF